MILAALLIVVLTLILFYWEALLALAIALLLFAQLCRYCQARLENRVDLVDFALQINQHRAPVIADRNHPLYCLRGARRGPEPPADLPEHTATGRFR